MEMFNHTETLNSLQSAVADLLSIVSSEDLYTIVFLLKQMDLILSIGQWKCR